MQDKVEIFMDDKNITDKIKEWNIISKEGVLKIKVIYLSGKKYYADLERCKITPTNILGRNKIILEKGVAKTNIEEAKIIGNKYLIIYFKNNEQAYVYKLDKLEIVESINEEYKDVLDYFLKIAELKDEKGNINRKIAKDLKKLIVTKNNALGAYLTGESNLREIPTSIIYPFGLNYSQSKAVENGLSSNVSIIEGPPGTGKTQTILNIIANIVINRKSVAVISNNDSAVKNVYEKLEKYGVGDIVAKLGSNDKINNFFEEYYKLKNEDIFKDNAKLKEDDTEILSRIENNYNKIKDILELNNHLAILKNEIKELEIEREYLNRWLSNDLNIDFKNFKIFKESSTRLVELLSLLEIIPENRVSIFRKLQLLIFYGIYDLKNIDNIEYREEIVSKIQLKFYDKKISEMKKKIIDIENRISSLNYKNLEENIKDDSINYFKQWLCRNLKNGNFKKDDYKKKGNFNEFTKRFPVIISTAYSIIGSLGIGNIVDYLIIDEASQLEIVPGILGLACAKNVIIVGDRKQLPHIPIDNGIVCPEENYNYNKNSILESFHKVFNGKIPVTLLREHYRCHPMIINFCNKQFYNNELIAMTKYTEEEALIQINTAKGNHMRFKEKGMINVREIESLFEDKIVNKVLSDKSIGFISPYRVQVREAEKFLTNEEILKDTVHKFQGRECDTIILSTVLDKKANKRNLEFVDDDRLINVAVSRAKKRFVLVTGENIFEKNKGNIDSLTRYMKYYAKESLIHKSKVVSNFDLLYKEYDESLERRKKKLIHKDSKYKSEVIIASVLRDLLKKEEFSSLIVHTQVRLKLIAGDVDIFTDDERKFIRRKSSCDFGIYFKVGKNPIGVIEVDGYKFHNNVEQKERDKLKDSIINKIGLKICRVATNESGEEKKIEDFLRELINKNY